MRYKRLLILLPLIIIITLSESCNQRQNNSTQVLKKDTCNCTADTIICNLKYSLYLLYADNQFSFNDDTTSQHFFSECELELDTLRDDNSELLCRVTFSYGTRQLNKANLKPSGNRLFVKIIYDKFKNKIVGYGTGDNVFFYVESPQSDRLVNPLQPEVVKFLKANDTILNCWFKSELIKKGIL